MSILGAAAIAGGASLVGQAFNAYQSGKMNKRAERFNREMYAKQRQDNLSDWHMQNAYNDPAAQMQRLQNANLNPHLVYGNGADAQMASPVRSSNISNPSYDTPRIDMGSVVGQALQAKQLQSNIAKTEAEADLIRSNTDAKKFDNQIRERVGLDNYVQQLDLKMRSANSQSIQEVTQFDSDFRAMYDYSGSEMSDKFVLADNKVNWNNSLMIKAKRAGIDKLVQDVDNAKKLGILRDDQHSLNLIEKQIKDFAGNLTKMGVSPTSIQFLGVMTTVLRTIFGK